MTVEEWWHGGSEATTAAAAAWGQGRREGDWRCGERRQHICVQRWR